MNKWTFTPHSKLFFITFSGSRSIFPLCQRFTNLAANYFVFQYCSGAWQYEIFFFQAALLLTTHFPNNLFYSISNIFFSLLSDPWKTKQKKTKKKKTPVPPHKNINWKKKQQKTKNKKKKNKEKKWTTTTTTKKLQQKTKTKKTHKN